MNDTAKCSGEFVPAGVSLGCGALKSRESDESDGSHQSSKEETDEGRRLPALNSSDQGHDEWNHDTSTIATRKMESKCFADVFARLREKNGSRGKIEPGTETKANDSNSKDEDGRCNRE